MVVLFDAWAAAGTNPNYEDTASAQTVFNHIPGGANVLYMDGHVSFVRLNGGIPVNMNFGAGKDQLQQLFGRYMWWFGGWG